MERHLGPFNAELREQYERLRELAEGNPGEWVVAGATVGERAWQIGWRADSDQYVTKHRVVFSPAEHPTDDGPIKELLTSLPLGFGVVGLIGRLEKQCYIAFLGQVRNFCPRCGEPMDQVARCGLYECCSICARNAGELNLQSIARREREHAAAVSAGD